MTSRPSFCDKPRYVDQIVVKKFEGFCIGCRTIAPLSLFDKKDGAGESDHEGFVTQAFRTLILLA